MELLGHQALLQCYVGAVTRVCMEPRLLQIIDVNLTGRPWGLRVGAEHPGSAWVHK